MKTRNSLTQASITVAALELIEQNGVAALTLASLAKQLGVRSPSLYNHVSGLNDVRRLLALHGLEQLHTALMRAVAGRSGDDAIRKSAYAYVDFVRSQPSLYDLTFLFPAGDDEAINMASNEILSLILQILEPYQLSESEALHMVRTMRSLMHGFASLEQKEGFGIPLATDDTLEYMLQMYLSGLSHLQHNNDKKDKS